MEKGQIDRQNKWKWAFLILVTLNLLLIISLSVSLFSNSKTTADQSVEQTGPVSPTSDQLQATVVLENGDIEALLSQALNASQNQSVSSISVTEIISMTGQLSVLGIPVDYVVEAEPFPMEDGNLQLKVNSIQLGNLSLPL
ncbi:MAG TPA: YpmS family protein, partial [Candidatus Jeotgalibaca merdavium]|nr:YpmS family protein [Candidatus Jeotgalibaca merdavium]